MGFIKTDPNQNKTVVALLGILAIAIGVTVYRVSGAGETQVAAKAATSSATGQAAVSSPSGASVCVYDRSRNPFRRPANVQTAMGETKPITLGNVRPIPDASAPVPQASNVSVLPMPVAMQKEQVAVKTVDHPNAKPDFVLHATVEDSHGACAVISVDGSEPRVIGIGDTIDGYKLIAVKENRAVLVSGRGTVVANRPKA